MNINKVLMVLFTALAPMVSWAAPMAEIKGPDLFTGQLRSVGPGVKGLVVAFLSAKCPCSHSHVVELKNLAKSFPDFQFVAVHSNQDESLEASRAYFKDQNFPFPVIQDGDLKWADHFRASKTPHIFVLSREGDIQFQGGVSDSSDFSQAEKNYLREALASLSQGRPAPQKFARTLGCAISRRSSNHVY